LGLAERGEAAEGPRHLKRRARMRPARERAHEKTPRSLARPGRLDVAISPRRTVADQKR
jgi:hypothetical protein